MPNEIAKCPMKGCGGGCSLGYGEFVGDLLVDRVGCNRCAYRGASPAVAGEAIAAHNELAEAAEIGRLMLKAANHRSVALVIHSDGSALVSAHDPFTAPVVDFGMYERESPAEALTALLDALRGLKEGESNDNR